MASHIGRRKFLGTLGGAAAAWPLAARAQQPAMPVVAFLHGDSSIGADAMMRAFHQGLNQSGFVEGRNVSIEYHFGGGHHARLPAMAADLVRRQVAVIVTLGNRPAILAAKAATTMVPIVFLFSGDPVAVGFVASLKQPGGNLTGVTTLNTEVGPKRFELLHELLPTATATALLVNPTSPAAEDQLREAQAAARTLGLQLHLLHAHSESDIDKAFTSLPQWRAGALVIGPDPLFQQQSEQFAALALRHAMPTISPYREFAAAGGLMSYGTDVRDLFRVAGVYTGRILKGERPADLPVQQATRIELHINMKIANALGLAVPPTLLARADEVIE
jgi:putative tryptophan/tyrosine transport system substrate-binding protein